MESENKSCGICELIVSFFCFFVEALAKILILGLNTVRTIHTHLTKEHPINIVKYTNQSK
jgi:hypothetical protein